MASSRTRDAAAAAASEKHPASATHVLAVAAARSGTLNAVATRLPALRTIMPRAWARMDRFGSPAEIWTRAPSAPVSQMEKKTTERTPATYNPPTSTTRAKPWRAAAWATAPRIMYGTRRRPRMGHRSERAAYRGLSVDMENSTAKNRLTSSGRRSRPRSRLRRTWTAVRGRACAMVRRKKTA